MIAKIQLTEGKILIGGADGFAEESSFPTTYWGTLASDPTENIQEGDEYYNSGTSKFKKYNGTSWIDLN